MLIIQTNLDKKTSMSIGTIGHKRGDKGINISNTDFETDLAISKKLKARKDKGLAFLLGLLNLAGVARLELATIGFGDRLKTKCC
nr:hypothetical protein BCU57_19235 [Shewanella sp. 10N.286.48.B5]